MKNQNYRFAVIGYGLRGQGHVREFKRVFGDQVKCVAAADVRPPTPAERAQFGRHFYRNYRQLLAHEQLDFVIVASQEAQHVTHALAALRRGVPVYVEKAVSSNWPGAVRLYREVVRHDYPLFVGYNLRRVPAARVVRQLLATGKIGFVQSVLAHVNAGTVWGGHVLLRAFYRDAARSGDIVLSKLTHDTDWVQSALRTHARTCTATVTRNVWTARPQVALPPDLRPYRTRHKTAPTSHDFCSASGLFANGTAYTFVLSSVGPDYERRYVFNGTHGQIDLLLHSWRPGRAKTAVTVWRYGRKPERVRLPVGKGGHGGGDARTYREFLHWLAHSPLRPHDPDSILTGVIIPIAALKSARLKREINCEEMLLNAKDNL